MSLQRLARTGQQRVQRVSAAAATRRHPARAQHGAMLLRLQPQQSGVATVGPAAAQTEIASVVMSCSNNSV